MTLVGVGGWGTDSGQSGVCLQSALTCLPLTTEPRPVNAMPGPQVKLQKMSLDTNYSSNEIPANGLEANYIELDIPYEWESWRKMRPTQRQLVTVVGVSLGLLFGPCLGSGGGGGCPPSRFV